MKTQEELVAKIKSEDGPFQFTYEVLIEYLNFDNALPFLCDEWKEKQAEWTTKSQERDAIIADMRDYMDFAWQKCLDHRGLSAGRSVEKMRVWLWLLDDVDSYVFAFDDRNYPQYGAPILAYISRKYNFPIPDSEDVRLMSQGKHCTAGWPCGCGS